MRTFLKVIQMGSTLIVVLGFLSIYMHLKKSSGAHVEYRPHESLQCETNIPGTLTIGAEDNMVSSQIMTLLKIPGVTVERIEPFKSEGYVYIDELSSVNIQQQLSQEHLVNQVREVSYDQVSHQVKLYVTFADDATQKEVDDVLSRYGKKVSGFYRWDWVEVFVPIGQEEIYREKLGKIVGIEEVSIAGGTCRRQEMSLHRS